MYRLVAEPLNQGLERTVPDRIREVVEAVRDMITLENLTVNQRQIAERLGRDQGVISRNVQAAIDQGFLVNDNPGQGRSGAIRIGERPLPNEAVLPTPEALAEAINGKQRDVPHPGVDALPASKQSEQTCEDEAWEFEDKMPF